MNGIFEILSNKEWMIQQEFLHSILPTLQYNIANHASLGIEREKKSPMAIGQHGQDFLREYQVTEDGNMLPAFDAWGEGDVLGKMKEPFVNVMPVDGPITRNGGACSYGSRDIRDWMMKAADNKFCQGHVLHINTPGGSAWAKNDFQQGIDYAHARGQRVIAFIDGLCASAGMYLASLCDEVYVMNPKDQLGCVGVMAAFFTMKNGDKDLSTGETYREYYDPESVDKNKEMRDIAEDEDATLLIEELKTLGEEFRADMKAAFPNAKDEHLKGKIFDAKDVMGILCDGEMMLGDVISRVFNLANGTEQPIERTASRKIAKRPAAAASASTVGSGSAAAPTQANTLSTTLNSINMKEKFPQIFALLGVESMECTEEGTFFNASLLETLNGKIEAMLQETAQAKELAESLTQEKAAMESQLTEKDTKIAALTDEKTALETAVTEKDAAIDAAAQAAAKAAQDMEAEHKAAIDQLTADHAAAITAKDEELNGVKASLTTAQNTLAERDQQISDLNATIDEMKQDAGAPGAASPANNGEGAEAAKVVVGCYVYNNDLTYEQNLEAEEKWNKEHGK